MLFKNRISVCLLAATLLAGMASCSKKDGADAENAAGQNEEAPLVKIETVHESDVSQNGTYTATIDPDLINNISASTPNRIKEIYVDEGMFVSQGQKVVVLDDVNLVNYELQVANAKVNLENIQTNYNRALELFKIGGGTKQNVDAMETQLKSARNSLASAERTLKNAQENTVLVSPITGVVTKRNYDPGDMTGSLPILTVAKVQPVKVVCNISESEFARVRKGMAAEVTVEALNDAAFNGTITMISPTVDNTAKTFGVEVTVPNPNNLLLPGMFARVHLNLGQERHVVVPDKAVVKQPGSGNQYVYVYKDGKVSYNQVELGQRLGDTYEIISGVAEGDQVVVSGQSKLANGMTVRVAK